MKIVPRFCLSLFCSFILAEAVLAQTVQERAFMSVWQQHIQSVADHEAVIDACRRVMTKASTTGEYLPVVKTIAAWHLLGEKKELDAIRLFESALVTGRSSSPIARHGDILARRWLSRFDIRKVEVALKRYYAEHVEFPASLSPLYALPKPAAPMKTDRFGDAWNYRLADFSRLTGLKGQRYVLTSKSLGTHRSRMKDFSFTVYCPDKKATLLGRRTASPVSVDLNVTVGEKTLRGTAVEGNLSNGIRFLKLSSDQRFALLTDSENDFWIVAPHR